MADNRRNNPNPDRIDADDLVDINGIRNASNEIRRLLGGIISDFSRLSRSARDENERNIDAAQREFQRLQDFMSDTRERFETDSTRRADSLSGIVAQGLNRGRAAQVQSNVVQIRNLERAVREGTRSFDSVRDEVENLLVTNNNLNNSINRTNTIVNGFSVVLGDISKYFGNYISSFVEGSEKYYRAYQQTFNSVSARLGMNYSDTRGVYHGMIESITSDMKSVVNIADDLVPALEKAARTGLDEGKVISKAYYDALDSKIMPWLDTSSDWYTNLFANLSEAQINQIKSSQLQLQETKSGNRLLQSGVINTLTSEMQPLLMSMDAKMGTDDLLPEMAAMLEGMVSKGIPEQVAYQMIKPMQDAILNPYSQGINGTTSQAVFSISHQNGDDIIEAWNKSFGMFADQANLTNNPYAAGALQEATGFNGSGVEAWIKYMGSFEDSIYEVVDKIGSNENAYNMAAKNASEHLTTSQKVENWLENTGTQLFGEVITRLPYGDKFYEIVTHRLGVIITTLVSMAASSIFSRSGGLGNIGTRLLDISRILGGRHVAGSTASNVIGGIGAGAVVAGGVTNAVWGGIDTYNNIREAADYKQIGLSATQAVAGLGAVAAVIAGSTGVGAILFGLGLAAKGVSNALDNTSAATLEVVDSFKKQKQEIDALTSSEDKRQYAVEHGFISQEEANKYTDAAIQNLLDYESSTKRLRELRRESQEEYNSRSESILKRIAELESNGNRDQVYDILQSAGATSKQLEKYLGGRSSADDILTSKKWWGIFGAKSLLQNATDSDWDILNSVAGIPGYATGLPYVTEDSTVRVHKGERILTSHENSEYAGMSVITTLEQSNDELIRTLREVASEIIIAIRDINNGNTVNTASNTIARPSVNYDGYAIGLMPQVGKV